MEAAVQVRVTAWSVGVLLGMVTAVAFAEPALPPGNPPPGETALYLRCLTTKPWWNAGWTRRWPVVIHEPFGLSRPSAPVSIVAKLPKEADLASVRVVTPWDEEIPSQIRVIEEAAREVELLCSINLRPKEYLPAFVYFSHQPQESPNYPPAVRVEEDDRFFTLSTSTMRVLVRRDSPSVVRLERCGPHRGNQLYDDHGRSPEGNASFKYASFSPGRATERGPLRATIEYEGTDASKPLRVQCSLVRDASRLDFGMRGAGAGSRSVNWLPGNGINPARPDGLTMASAAGTQRISITGPGSLKENLAREFAEGWYAYHDPDTGLAAGEIFDLEELRSFEVYIHIVHGYATSTGFAQAPGATRRGSLVCLEDRGGCPAFRQEYLRFMHPPQILLGPMQTRESVPDSRRVPVFGKNLIRCYHQSFRHYAGARVYPEAPHRVIPHLLQSLRRDGANWVSMWAYQPFWPSKGVEGPSTQFLDHLVRASHQDGMGVEVHSLGTGPQAASEIAAAGVDIFPVKDESCWQISSDADKERFRKEYGMDPAEAIEVDKLALPAHHNRALFQMDRYTEMIRAMAEAAKSKSRSIVVSDQVNVSSMVRIELGAPHDWEKHSDFLDSLSMDLYGLPNEHWKYYAKLMRATFGNAKPIMMYWGCDPRPETVKPNLDYLLMWGVDALFYFSPGSIYTPAHDEVVRNYRRLEYTGLGDLLAQYEPARYVALFRDREGMVDSIRRGLWTNGGSVYDGRIQSITGVRNLPTDILFSKYCTLDVLKTYPLLMVVNDPVLSDTHAQAIRSYLEGGGKVILEGEGIRNRALQELTGIVPRGDPERREGTVEPKPGFSFSGYAVPVESKASAPVSCFADKTPVLYSIPIGKGCLLYTPLILSEKLSYQEDVTEFLRGLIHGLIGRPPVFLDPASGAVDSNLLCKAGNYLLAIHSKSLREERVGLGCEGSPPPPLLLNFTTGEQQVGANRMEVLVPPGETVFLYLGDKAGLDLPEATPASWKDDTAYTGYPGKRTFAATLSLPEEAEGRARKRQKEEGFRYVAVLTDQGNEAASWKAWVKGDDGIYEALLGARGLKVEYIRDTKPETVAFYDAVIIPHIGHATLPPVMDSAWGETIRDYVRNGGAALLCHHAAGYRSLCPPIFPEVGEPTGAYVAIVKDMVIKADHPITNAQTIRKRFPGLAADPAFQDQFQTMAFRVGDQFQSSYPDYLPLKPGQGGAILAQAAIREGVGGEPVVLAGTVGKGRAVLTGLALGAKDNQAKGYTAGERQILINAVYWLTERDF